MASFPNRVGQWLLAVDMLAHPHGHHGRRRVHMVGSRDDDRIDFVGQFAEHQAVVCKVLDSGKGFVNQIEALGVDIAKAHEFDFGMTADLG